jgi:hypothetical protein
MAGIWVDDVMRGRGKYGYKCFYKGRTIEVWANTLLEARDFAASYFKAKKPWDVTAILCERPDGSTVEHDPSELPGG